MNNQFLISFYEIIEQPEGNFIPSPDNPIEINDIENQDTVIKAIKDIFLGMEIINAEKLVNNAKKVSFSITDSNKNNTFWSGEGTIQGNQIDIIKIESPRLQC